MQTTFDYYDCWILKENEFDKKSKKTSKTTRTAETMHHESLSTFFA
jgi:hypothetical protein